MVITEPNGKVFDLVAKSAEDMTILPQEKALNVTLPDGRAVRYVVARTGPNRRERRANQAKGE